jgi:hypothetical protein
MKVDSFQGVSGGNPTPSRTELVIFISEEIHTRDNTKWAIFMVQILKENGANSAKTINKSPDSGTDNPPQFPRGRLIRHPCPPFGATGKQSEGV